MSDSAMCSIRVLSGVLYNGTWLEPDTVCDMPRELATPYSKSTKQRRPLVVILGEPTGNEIEPPKPRPRQRVVRRDPKDTVGDDGVERNGGATRAEAGAATTVATELDDMPGSDAFVKHGITTIDAVRALIAKHGDSWPKKVKGIGKATAADVGTYLAELDGAGDDDEYSDDPDMSHSVKADSADDE